MKRTVIVLTVWAISTVGPGSAKADDVVQTPNVLADVPSATEPILPPPLDINTALVLRYWDWLKTETGAPADLPLPRILVEPLPPNVRMAFSFPTAEAPWREMRVIVSPLTIDRATHGQRLEVLGELAHELVHYILVLEENGFELGRDVYLNEIHHHCDPRFQSLTRYVGDVIWQAYHSNDAVRAIDGMVLRACWRDGHRLSRGSLSVQ